MEVLERSENPKKYFLPAIGVGALLVSSLQRLSIPYPFVLAGLLVGLGILLWATFGNKPAAWIKGDHLYIFNGLFSPLTLFKPEIEELSYKAVSNSEHMLIAKLKSGSNQSILIHDRKEHIKDERLSAFINQYFMAIKHEASNQ